MLLSQHLAATATKSGGSPATHYLGKDSSYSELQTAVARLSYLYQNEVGHGARVAFLTRNSPAVISTFFALTNIRAVVIPISPELPPDETIDWLKESKATHIGVTSDLVNTAKDLLHAAHLNLPVIDIEKKHGGEYDKSFTPPPDNPPKEADPILLLRTAGTTGKPKLVSFTHKQLLHAANFIKSHYHIRGNDRLLTTMSWSHPFAFIHAMLFPILNGATCVVDHGLEGVDFLKFVKDAKTTRMIGTAPFFQKYLYTCRGANMLPVGIKSVTIGLGNISSELRKAFKVLKIAVSHCYGQTENAWTVALEDIETGNDAEHEQDHEAGTGRGVPGLKYKVLDVNGDEIEGSDARTGLLAVTGPTVMSGYPGFEKETKNTIRGTWLYTGDIARLEGQGEDLKITFIGRKEDVIEIDGEPIIPVAIDRVLHKLAAAKDGAGFVVLNSKNQPMLMAAVVKKEGAALNEKQVQDFCATHLGSSSLQPRAIVFTDVIPRDAGGNVNRSRLRNMFTGTVT